MNQAILDDLTAYVLQAVGPLSGSRSRKQQMQEELLAHLLSLYDEELVSLQDEQAAAVRAKQRFGRVDHLCSELQAAVPLLERLVFVVYGKGNLMKRWLWIIGCVAVYVAGLLGRFPSSSARSPVVQSAGSLHQGEDHTKEAHGQESQLSLARHPKYLPWLHTISAARWGAFSPH